MSNLWRELEQGKNERGVKIVTFKHCQVAVTANPNSGTSHLKCHLDRCLQIPSGLVVMMVRTWCLT